MAARTFADARPGDIILYEDAYRNVAVAISGGSAADLFGVAPRAEVRIHLRVAVSLATRADAGPALRARRDERRRRAGRGSGAASAARCACQFDRLAPELGRGCGGPTRLRRSRRALRLVARAAGACSTSERAPAPPPSRSRGASRRPRSSASTWRRRMLAKARANTPPELAGRVRFEPADARARCRSRTAPFDLVVLANMIPFFDELARVVAPGGCVVFAFSAGPETPIWVPPERLRRELGARGFAEFADFQPRRRHGAACPEGRPGLAWLTQGRSRRGSTGPDVLFSRRRGYTGRPRRGSSVGRAHG